ncbi:MAG: metal ABC transporter permease [Paracoccaceae bacterium]
MIDIVLLPFQLEFMRNAMIIAVLVAVPTALLSCFMVLKGWSLMGDAVSHAVFPGVVLAHIVGLPYAIGAFVAGMICALAAGFIKDNSRIKQDTVLGVVFAGMFGLGLVLYTNIQTEVHLDHILFGNIMGTGLRDLIQSGVIALLVAGVLVLKRHDLLLHAFDPGQAQAMGLRVGWLHYGLLALLSLTVVGALEAVGVILAIATLIAPGAIAFLLVRRFGAMLIVAVAVSVFAALAGVYISFFIDAAPAPTIVLLLSGAFIVAFAHASHKARRAAARAHPINSA